MKHLASIRRGAALGLAAAVAIATAFALADPPRGGYAPDPPGQASKKQWIFEVSYRDGKASLGKVSSVSVTNPTATARVIGRFALEFHLGKELLDRLRFDVPLVNDDATMHRKGPLSGPRFSDVTTRLKVRMADSPRASYVVLLDRSTGEAQRFWWPPDAEGRLSPMNASAGADAGADAGDAGPPGDGGVRDAGPAPSDAGHD